MFANNEENTIAKITIHDIARQLNITASTVSRALNGHPGISDATKSIVEQTAKNLNYHRNNIASSLRLGKSKIIGVIIPSVEINFFGAVVNGIEKVARENDYTIIIYQSNELAEFEKKGVETFLRSRVDCVLASFSKETINPDHYREIKNRGIPLVLFDRTNDDLGVPSVVVDDYRGAFNATQHLIDQGCKRIAHIGGQQHVLIFNQRKKGYIDALRANNILVDENLIVYGKVTIESGKECMLRLLALKETPDAIFTVEDFTALGAMQALKDTGKKIPEDVAVIGFANEPFGQYITPSLSTVNQHATKMGEEAARLFFNVSEKNGFYQLNPPKIVLEPALVLRNSSLKRPI